MQECLAEQQAQVKTPCLISAMGEPHDVAMQILPVIAVADYVYATSEVRGVLSLLSAANDVAVSVVPEASWQPSWASSIQGTPAVWIMSLADVASAVSADALVVRN